jgi:glycosyltransferase involved in cell wall biosynthesis
MKVLFILPEFYPNPGGGISTYYLNYLHFLAQENVDIKVMVGSSTTTGTEDVIWNGISIEFLKIELLAKYKKQFAHWSMFPELQMHLASAWAMYEQADEKGDYNIIETTDWGLGYIPWVLKSKKKVVVRLHGSIAQIEDHDPRTGYDYFGLQYKHIEASTLPLADRLVTHSFNNKQSWEAILGGDVQCFYPLYKPSLLNEVSVLLPKGDYALVVGRVQAWKGAEMLCKALEAIDIAIPVFWIGRDTDYKRSGQSYSSYLSQKYPGVWGKKIIPLGSKPNDECLMWMYGAKFGIVPSTWDMFNFTAIEWMHLKKPIICSNGAGASSLLAEIPDAAIYEQDNQAELGKLLVRYASLSKQEVISAGNECYRQVVKHINNDELKDKNIELYRQLLLDDEIKIKKSNDNDWLHSIWTPRESKDSQLIIQTSLDQLPVASMLTAIKKRAKSKFIRK